MSCRAFALVLFFVFPFIDGCARKDVRGDAGGTPAAVLLLTADMRGYLGPCGCSENMRGGIARAAYQVSEARKEAAPVLFIEGGNSLFGKLALNAQTIPQEERKAQALAAAMKLMGVSTKVVGTLDDARGATFRASLGLPDQPLGSVQMLDANGRAVAVVAASTADQLFELSAKARTQGAAFVLGVLHQPIAQAQAVTEREGLAADLIFATVTQDELAGEENRLVRGKVPVVQVQSKGRSLARVDLTFGGRVGTPFELIRGEADKERELSAFDQRIELLRKQVNEPSLAPQLMQLRKAKLEETIHRRHTLAFSSLPTPKEKNAMAVRFLPLESSLPSLPEAKALVTAYDQDVGLINLAWAKEHGADCPPPGPKQAAFIGNEGCQSCHEEAFAAWNASKHAHAYRTLEEVGKHFHLDCVKCHVTGADQPGGVCRIDKVDGRKDVGCESCHGPGSLHAEDPDEIDAPLGNRLENCVGCHDPENSPHFELVPYREKILGPGHGKPLAGKN
ncbi:MAG: multiheme c-type cytochrome [Myxococcota bacterium]